MAATVDFGEKVAPESLDLATRCSLKRTQLSAERTLMSWIRTSFSMISFGFTIGKFLQYLESQPGADFHVGQGNAIPTLLILLGLVSLFVGIWEFRHMLTELKATVGVAHRVAPVGIIAVLVGLLGVLAFVGLFVRIDIF
jgi:putative membrane protein